MQIQNLMMYDVWKPRLYLKGVDKQTVSVNTHDLKNKNKNEQATNESVCKQESKWDRPIFNGLPVNLMGGFAFETKAQCLMNWRPIVKSGFETVYQMLTG